jgi:NAD-dependent DNA ligase
MTHPMDPRAIIERIRELQQEISEIKAANRVYWALGQPSLAEKNLYERRRQRLQEIKTELPALVRRSLS